MSWRELIEWSAYFRIQEEDREDAARKSELEARLRANMEARKRKQ